MNGVAVHLTGREFDLLKLFRTSEKVFSRANLYETVWQEPYFDSEKTVNMHISIFEETSKGTCCVYSYGVGSGV